MKEPLKVLWYFSFPGGGIGRYSHCLCNELTKNSDLEIVLLTQAAYEWRDEARYRVLPDLFRLSHPLALLRRARFALAQWINPLRLIRCARGMRPDVIHLADVNHLLSHLWASRLFGQSWRVVLTVHDVRRGVAALNRRMEERNLINLYRGCDALFVHSAVQRQELVEFAGISADRIHIVPHGPSLLSPPAQVDDLQLRSKWQVPLTGKILLFFGFIKDYKGLDTLLKALAAAPPELNLHLLIAGAAGSQANSSWRACRAFIEQAQLGERVTSHIRYLSEEEMSELFAISDALVLPYKREFTSQSGVLNIASAVECPVIATPCPAFVEGMQSGRIGVLARDFSPEAFLDAILEYCRQAEGSWEFARYSDTNSWQRSVAITRDVYHQLAEQQA